MFRVPVALLLLALVVIPRLPAIPTGPALLHRVPRAAPGTQSDLEGDTDVLVQDVDQVINKVNKALGDTDDSAGTDSDDAAKGLSVKTTEVRISPTQDQKTDEGDDTGNTPDPVELKTNGEEEKPDEKSAQGITEDALLGAVIQDALENPKLLQYFLSKAGDAEDVLLADKDGESVPSAFLSPQKAPVADNAPEVEIVEEPPKPVADSVNLEDEKTEKVLEELEADHEAQESADLLDEEEEDYDEEEDLDEEKEMEGADEDAELDASVLGLLGPQKSVAFTDEVIEEDDVDDEDLDEEDEDEDLGEDDDENDDTIDEDSEDDDDEYVDSDDVIDDDELPDDVNDDVD